MADKTIKIKGEFDASGILASFKKIRDEAAKANVNDKILAGYDKELAKVEKLTTQIIAQSNKGLTNSNDIKEYTRTVNQLEKAYGILNVKAQDFADANNYSRESAEVRKYATQLQNLIQKQEGLRKAAEDYIDTNRNSLKISKDEANQLKKSIADAEAYKKVVDDIVEAKMKAAQQKAAPLVLQTQGGQQKIEEISNQQKNFGFSVAARKGPDKSKEALVGKDGAVKEVEALAAAQAEYNRILRETIQTGGSADDAMKEFTKSMKGYKLEVTNADEIQEEFRKDIEETTQAALANRQGLSRGDNQKLINAGKEMAGAQALQNTVNSAPITAVQQNAQAQVQAEDSINKALEQRIAELEQIVGLSQKDANVANQASNQIVNDYRKQAQEAQKNVDVQKSIENGFERISRGAKQILSVTTAWRSLRNVVKSTFNDVKALDKSFASIAMVTSYSVKDMWAQYDQYAAMANKLGQSTKSVVEASALYYQQGLKTNEVMQLTEETMKLATLAGLDFKDATSQMTAALRAFHMDMSEGAHVTDVYAEVAAHAAVDVQGLSEAMSACASIANSSGMAFEKTTAMLATMTEATQEAPKNLGTALKTVLARFTELKTNVAGTADSEFDDLDYNKVDKALKSVGVQLKDTNGQFRNMDDVLLELSSKWNTLDRNSQRYIATIAAGSRQQSRFIALMENYERTMQLVNVAQNSAGRSSQQFAKYQDTVEYRLNQISNTWEQFKTGLLSSDFYKDVLDNFNSFLNKLNDMSTTGLATLAGTWMTFGRKAISGTMDAASGLFSNLGKAKNPTAFKEDYFHKNQQNYLDQNGILTGEAQEQIFKDADKAWEEQKAKSALKSKALGTAISASITAGITSGLASDTAGDAVVASIGTSLIPNIMAGVQMGGPHGTILAVGATLASGLIAGITNHIKSNAAKELNKTIEQQVKNAQKALDKSTSRLEQKQSEARSTQSTIDDLKDIEKQYNELKNKVVLTEEEQEKYNKLVDNLKENYPSLIAYYDEETKKIRLNNEELKKRKETLTELEKQQNADALQEQFYNTTLAQQKSELDVKNKYYSELKSTLSLSSSDAEKLSKNIASVSSSGLDDFKNQVKVLAEKNNASKEVLDQINTTLEDFEASYNSVQDKDDENYNLILSQLRSENEKKENPLTDTEMRIRAEKILKESANVDDEVSKKVSSLTGNISQSNYNERAWVSPEKDGFWKTLGKFALGIPTMGISTLAMGAQSATVAVQEMDKLKDWENLDANVRDFLKNELKYTEDSYKELLKDSGNDIKLVKKTLTQQTEAYYKTQKYKEESEKELTPEEKAKRDEISELEKNYSKYSVSDLQKEIEAYKEKEGEENAKRLLAGLPLDELESYQTLLKEFGLESDKTFQGLSSGVMEYSSQILQSLKDTFGANSNVGEIYKGFVESIQKFNLPKDLTNKLLSFNPKDLEGQTKEDAKESLMTLFNDTVNSGQITKDAAKKTVEQYLDNLEKSGIGNFSIKNASSIDAFIEKAKKKYQDTVTNYKSAIDTINSNISNGFIDYLDKDKIEEAIKSLDLDPSKYLFTDEQGNYQIDVDKLNEDVQNQLTNEDEIAKELQEQVREGINQLTQKKSIIKSIISQYNAEKNITKELALQRAIQSEPLNSKRTFNEIAEQFAKTWNGTTATFTQQSIKEMEAELLAIDTQIEELKRKANDPEAIEALKKERLAAANAIKDIYKTNAKAVEDFKKAEQDAAKDLVEKNKAVIEAKKALAKAIENVTEKQKELVNVIKGTDWKSSLDGMYNYDTALDALTKKTERAKKELDKSMDEDSVKRNAQIYGQSLLDQKANIQAQIQIYKKAIANYNKTYREKLGPELNKWEEQSGTKFDPSKYTSYNEKTGRYQINVDKLQKDKLPKQVKSWIEEYIKTVNEYQGKIEDFQDKEKELDEEYLEWKKQVRDDYIDLQQKMMDVLREKYQKEIDDLQNKYDAMEEADQNYLNALQKNLDKQRKLRDQEENWRELTDKERKLSLMQRDTSRGNIGEVKSLEKEVEDQRTSLLDTAVDDIIEKLQEFYDLQKESRDAEIEYKETLLSDVNLLKEVTEELKKIHTSEDLVNWWKKNVSNIAQMSEEEFNREKDEWSNLIKAKQNYSASIDETFKKSIENAEGKLKDVADETEKVVKTTSEEITKLADTTLQEAGEEYKKAIKAAKDALADAVDAVQKQKDALQSALDAAEASKKAFDDIHAKYMEYLNAHDKSKPTVVYKVGDKYFNTEQEAQRYIEGSPQDRRNKTFNKETVTQGEAEELTKPPETPKTETPKTEEVKKVKKYIGIHNKDANLYENNDSTTFNQYNPYKNKGEIEIEEGIKHGVLEYKPTLSKWVLVKDFKTKEEGLKWINNKKEWMINHEPYSKYQSFLANTYAFAQGGLVDYTGPAWVDGSRSRPEAFLSAEDTRRIGEAARILSDLPILSQSIDKDKITNNTIGDTNIQIEVNVDQIASDYDVDEAVNRVEQKIVEAAKYAGSNVILKKR